MLFRYLAVSKSGVKKNGLIRSNSFDEAAMIMKSKDLNIIFLKRKFIFFQDKLSDFDLFLMFDFLSKFMANGLTLDKALDMVYECSIKCSTMCLNVKYLLVKGFSFSEALLKNKDLFNSSNVGIFSVIDKAGSLPSFCSFLAKYYKKMHDCKRKIRKNTRYPILLCIFFFVSLVVMMLFLIPSIVELMIQMGQNVPSVLLFMYHISMHFSFYSAIFACIIGLIVVFRNYFSNWINIIPIVRKYRMCRDFSFFFYTTNVLLGNEVRLINAFKAAKSCMLLPQNVYTIERICKNVESGFSISDAFKGAGVEDKLYRMLGLYERSANLQCGFQVVSEMYEAEMFGIIDGVGDYLQPIILSFITAVIGLTIYGLMMPIYNSFSV